MPFTGEEVYGWRIAKLVDGRRPLHGTGFAAWVDEVVVELVKGQRHIYAKGQHGIDPQIVLDRAITKGLQDDLREAKERNAEPVELMTLAIDLEQHERRCKVRENGFIARRLMSKGKAAVFTAGPATAGAKGRS